MRKDKKKTRANADAITRLSYKGIEKLIGGEQPNRDETIAMVVKYKSLKRTWRKLITQRYTNVYIQEIVNAKSKAEKTAVGIRMSEDKFSRRMLDGKDRKGIKFLDPPWVHPTEEVK